MPRLCEGCVFVTKTSVTMNDEIISGVLHAYVAFDWGEEVDLVQAAKLL